MEFKPYLITFSFLYALFISGKSSFNSEKKTLDFLFNGESSWPNIDSAAASNYVHGRKVPLKRYKEVSLDELIERLDLILVRSIEKELWFFGYWVTHNYVSFPMDDRFSTDYIMYRKYSGSSDTETVARIFKHAIDFFDRSDYPVQILTREEIKYISDCSIRTPQGKTSCCDVYTEYRTKLEYNALKNYAYLINERRKSQGIFEFAMTRTARHFALDFELYGINQLTSIFKNYQLELSDLIIRKIRDFIEIAPDNLVLTIISADAVPKYTDSTVIDPKNESILKGKENTLVAMILEIKNYPEERLVEMRQALKNQFSDITADSFVETDAKSNNIYSPFVTVHAVYISGNLF